MRRPGVLLAGLGGVLCVVALFVPFDTGYPPRDDPAIVPISLFSTHFDWILWSLPILLGMIHLLVFGILAWRRKAAVPLWVVGSSLGSLGWLVCLLYFDVLKRMIEESATSPFLGFWMIVAGFLLGSIGTILSRVGHQAAPTASDERPYTQTE